MKEFKGTPGPWNVVFTDRDKPGIDSKHKTIVLWGDVFDCAGIINSGEEQKANAQLIAAAPELLEALQEMVYLFGGDMPKGSTGYSACQNAKEAINKALGL